MKSLLWVGLAVVVLGIALLVVPIPSSEREAISAGGMSMTVQTQHSERVSPFVSGLLIFAGAGMIYAGRAARRA